MNTHMDTIQPKDQTEQAVMTSLALLVESPTNPRTFFDPAFIKDLAKNITKNGIIQPLIVRLLKADAELPEALRRREIVAGAQRYRAAKLAKFTEAPCIVRDYDERQVLEVQLIENLQRRDLHPLEEATSFDSMINRVGYTVKELAAKIGRDETYVYRRRFLANLHPSIKEAFMEGEINIGHAELTARHDVIDQQRIFDEGLFSKVPAYDEKEERIGDELRAVTVEALRKWIERNIMKSLAKVAWLIDDPTLVPMAGSCSACMKRTGKNLVLFAEFAAKDDRCLDGGCYENKLKTHVARELEQAASKGTVLVEIQKGWEPEKLPATVVAAQNYREAGEDAKTCDYMEKAIVTRGYDVGKVTNICRNAKCPVHGKIQTAKPDKWEKEAGELPAKIEAAARHRILDAVLRTMNGVKGFTKYVLAIIGGALVDRLAAADDDQALNRLANRLALDEAETSTKGDFDREKVIATLKAMVADPSKTHLQTFVNRLIAIALEPSALLAYPDKSNALDQAATWLKVDAAEIKKATAKELREDLAARKKASLAKGDKMQAKINKKAAKGAPVAGTCHLCGCTDKTPCNDPKTGGPCEWTDDAKTTCSACVALDPKPKGKANKGSALAAAITKDAAKGDAVTMTVHAEGRLSKKTAAALADAGQAAAKNMKAGSAARAAGHGLAAVLEGGPKRKKSAEAISRANSANAKKAAKETPIRAQVDAEAKAAAAKKEGVK